MAVLLDEAERLARSDWRGSSIRLPLARSTILRVSSCSSSAGAWSCERPHLPEAADGHLDGGDQLAALERLDQVGQGAGVAGLLDEVALAERGEDEHGGAALGGDLPGGRRGRRGPGILMSRMARSGSSWPDQLDGLVAAAGLAHDLVALLLEGLLEVEADDGLVLGDHDAGRHRSVLPRFAAAGTDGSSATSPRSGRPSRRCHGGRSRAAQALGEQPVEQLVLGASPAGRSRPRPRPGGAAWRRRGGRPRGAPARPSASPTPAPAAGRRRLRRRGAGAARRRRRAPRGACVAAARPLGAAVRPGASTRPRVYAPDPARSGARA